MRALSWKALERCQHGTAGQPEQGHFDAGMTRNALSDLWAHGTIESQCLFNEANTIAVADHVAQDGEPTGQDEVQLAKYRLAC